MNYSWHSAPCISERQTGKRGVISGHSLEYAGKIFARIRHSADVVAVKGCVTLINGEVGTVQLCKVGTEERPVGHRRLHFGVGV